MSKKGFGGEPKSGVTETPDNENCIRHEEKSQKVYTDDVVEEDKSDDIKLKGWGNLWS